MILVKVEGLSPENNIPTDLFLIISSPQCYLSLHPKL